MCKFWDELPENDVAIFHRIAGLYFYDAFSAVVEELGKNWETLARHRPLVAELHRMQGYCLMKLERSAEALRAFAQALASDPDNEKFRDNLRTVDGVCRQRMEYACEMKEWEPLRELCGEYLRVFPGVPVANWYLGIAIDNGGDAAGAVPIFQDLARRFPTEVNYWNSLCVSLRRSGCGAQALVACRQGIAALEKAGLDTQQLQSCLAWLEEDCGVSEEKPAAEKAPALN